MAEKPYSLKSIGASGREAGSKVAALLRRLSPPVEAPTTPEEAKKLARQMALSMISITPGDLKQVLQEPVTEYAARVLAKYPTLARRLDLEYSPWSAYFGRYFPRKGHVPPRVEIGPQAKKSPVEELDTFIHETVGHGAMDVLYPDIIPRRFSHSTLPMFEKLAEALTNVEQRFLGVPSGERFYLRDPKHISQWEQHAENILAELLKYR